MILPQHFFDEYLAKAEGCRMFGEPIENLTKEEMLATIAFAFEDNKIKARAINDNRKDFLEKFSHV